MKPIRRRPSRTALLYQQSQQSVARLLSTWDRLIPFDQRVLLARMGMPRSLYKYRAIPDAKDTEGRGNLEDFLVNNRLWLAKVRSFNDPFEGSADYDVPYRGEALRAAMERKYRELGFSSQAAKAKVDSADVADPSRLVNKSRRANRAVLEQVGVCALGTNPSSPLLWAHYAHDHKGICVQLRPVKDLAALIAHPVEYSDDYPLITDMFEPPERRQVLPIMRKSKDWAYEEEWRIVALDSPNTHRAFAPEAMSAVILGIRIDERDKAYVIQMMDERERRYGVRPILYQAEADKHHYRIVVRRLR